MPECELFKLRYFKVDSNILYDVQFVNFLLPRSLRSWIVSDIITYHHIPVKQNMNKHIIIALHCFAAVMFGAFVLIFIFFAEFSMKQIYQNENKIRVKLSKVKHFFPDKFWKHFDNKSQHQLNATTQKWFILQRLWGEFNVCSTSIFVQNKWLSCLLITVVINAPAWYFICFSNLQVIKETVNYVY